MFDRLVRFDPLPSARPEMKANLASLFLRLGLAAIFIYHGLEKIFATQHHWGTSWATRMWLDNPATGHVGTEVPGLLFPAVQLLVAWAELLGGVALLVGLFSRIAAIALIAIQLGAIWLVTFSRGFTGLGGYEYNVALIVMCLAVAVLGDGALTVDRLLAPARESAARAEKSEPLQPVG